MNNLKDYIGKFVISNPLKKMSALLIIALGLIVFTLNIYESLVQLNDVFNCCDSGLVSHVSLIGFKNKKLKLFSITSRLFCTGMEEDYKGFFDAADDPDIPKDNEGQNLTQYRAACEQIEPGFGSTWNQPLISNDDRVYHKHYITELNNAIPDLWSKAGYYHSEMKKAGTNSALADHYRKEFKKCINYLAEINKFRIEQNTKKVFNHRLNESRYPILKTILEEQGHTFIGRTYIIQTIERRGLTYQQLLSRRNNRTYSTLAYRGFYESCKKIS